MTANLAQRSPYARQRAVLLAHAANGTGLTGASKVLVSPSEIRRTTLTGEAGESEKQISLGNYTLGFIAPILVSFTTTTPTAKLCRGGTSARQVKPTTSPISSLGY